MQIATSLLKRTPLQFQNTSHRQFFCPSQSFILYSRITFNLVKTVDFDRVFKHLGVGVGSLLLSEGGHHIHEAPVVLDATLSTASLLLLLLLLVNLDATGRGMSFL